MAAVLEAFDDLVSGAPGDRLATWVAAGSSLATEPVRCPVTDGDGAASQRLDLALRMLRGQAPCQWCRPVDRGTVVVRRWPLPARAAVLYGEDDSDGALGLVLAVGRPHGAADVWRFRFGAAETDVVARGRSLLPR